jgi:hypothetical protein
MAELPNRTRLSKPDSEFLKRHRVLKSGEQFFREELRLHPVRSDQPFLEFAGMAYTLLFFLSRKLKVKGVIPRVFLVIKKGFLMVDNFHTFAHDYISGKGSQPRL